MKTLHLMAAFLASGWLVAIATAAEDKTVILNPMKITPPPSAKKDADVERRYAINVMPPISLSDLCDKSTRKDRYRAKACDALMELQRTVGGENDIISAVPVISKDNKLTAWEVTVRVDNFEQAQQLNVNFFPIPGNHQTYPGIEADVRSSFKLKPPANFKNKDKDIALFSLTFREDKTLAGVFVGVKVGRMYDRTKEVEQGPITGRDNVGGGPP